MLYLHCGFILTEKNATRFQVSFDEAWLNERLSASGAGNLPLRDGAGHVRHLTSEQSASVSALIKDVAVAINEVCEPYRADDSGGDNLSLVTRNGIVVYPKIAADGYIGFTVELCSQGSGMGYPNLAVAAATIIDMANAAVSAAFGKHQRESRLNGGPVKGSDGRPKLFPNVQITPTNILG